MATWKPHRIYDIISEIEDEKYVLPVIQRRLVWEEEKIELLFDTVLKGDSFGGIMVIEEEKDTIPLFNFRPFTKDGEPISSRQMDNLTQKQYFVIDGQQRLQAFYIGLKGSFNGKVLYFDLFSDYLNKFEFDFEADMQKLPSVTKDSKERIILEHNWYLVKNLTKRLKDTGDEDQVAREIIISQKITDDLKKTHIFINVRAFYKNIIDAECLGISKVGVNKSLLESINRQKIVELFIRLNDGGTKLSSFDLVASKLKGFEWEMESFLDSVLDEFKDIGLSQDNLIKLVFLLQDNYNKEMVDINAADAEFAIKNKDRIKSSLTCLRKFLKASELYNFYKDGNRSFIPLFFVLYHVFHKKITDNQIESLFDSHDTNDTEFIKIKKWINYSLLNGVFRSKGAGWIPYKTGIKQLLSEIKQHKNCEFPIVKLFDVYYKHGITFTESFDISNIENFDSQFLFYLIYDKKEPIRIQDIDHIMPKSILSSLNYDWSMINSINNFQLIFFKTNRDEKRAKPFKVWLENWDNEVIANFVSQHLIPKDQSIWTEDKFEQFIQERAKLILEKVLKNVN